MIGRNLLLNYLLCSRPRHWGRGIRIEDMRGQRWLNRGFGLRLGDFRGMPSGGDLWVARERVVRIWGAKERWKGETDLGVWYVFELADIGVSIIEITYECTGASFDC